MKLEFEAYVEKQKEQLLKQQKDLANKQADLANRQDAFRKREFEFEQKEWAHQKKGTRVDAPSSSLVAQELPLNKLHVFDLPESTKFALGVVIALFVFMYLI